MQKKHNVWDGAVDPDTKALTLGFDKLSDSELLAIVIRTGSAEANAMEVSSQLLAHRDRQLLNLYDMDVQQLQSFPGIGKIKALQLKAVGEAARRIISTERRRNLQFDDPESVANYFMEELRHEPQEHVIAAFFDLRGAFIGKECISVGSVERAFLAPRDIFRQALAANACFVTVLHNHPSGIAEPSPEDNDATKRLIACGKIIDIPLLDHIIIGDNTFFSYFESGLLQNLGG